MAEKKKTQIIHSEVNEEKEIWGKQKELAIGFWGYLYLIPSLESGCLTHSF